MGNLSHTSGNVGIGTSNPTSLLHVYGSNPVLNIQNTAASAGSGGEVVFGHDQNSNTTPIASVKGSLVNGGGAGSRAGELKFYTSNAGSLTERMVLTRDGRLGIGVASPTEALDVLGGVKISGTLTVVGSLSVPTLAVTSLPGFTVTNGILFPSTPNLSSNPRVLDEYEEGTWTPKFVHRGGTNTNWADLTVTYNTTYTKGEYTRIGNVVHWTAEVYTNSAPTGYGSGNLYLILFGPSNFTGLSGGTNYGVSWGDSYPRKTGRVGYAAGFSGYAPVYAYHESSNVALFKLCGGAHTANAIYLQPSNMTATTHLMMSGTQLLDNTFLT